jgi:hypothetical protein
VVRRLAYDNLKYDNLKPAVTRILVGSERELSARFVALASHDLVESRGRARWQHWVPIPSGQDLRAISTVLLARLDAQAEKMRREDRRTIAERFVTLTHRAERFAFPRLCPRDVYRRQIDAALVRASSAFTF